MVHGWQRIAAMNWERPAAFGPLRNFNVCFARVEELKRTSCVAGLKRARPARQRRARAGVRASLRRSPGTATPLRCSVSWPLAELAPLASLSTLKQRREVSLRSALRAQAKSPVLLSAEEARCHLPGRAFAEALVLFVRAVRPSRAPVTKIAQPFLVLGRRTSTVPARGGRHPAGAISEATRSAGLGSARLRASISDSPRLSERNERSEWSEFCGATPSRAPQCSRRTRRPPPHEPLAGAAHREPLKRRQEARTVAKDLNGP